LAEYWHLEPEMAYYNNDKNMKLQDWLVSYIANRLAENEDLLKALGVNADDLKEIKPPFKRIKYEEAIEIINSKGGNLKWGGDFGVPEEKMLTEDEDKPIFIYA